MQKTTEAPQDRRAQILEAATALFAQQGFHGVGMRSIADAVGVRSSSLYHHFPSKTDILYAITLSATQAFIDDHLERLESWGSPSERLRRLIVAHVTYFWEHRVQEAVGLRELRELEPDRYEEVQGHRIRYQRSIAELIEEGCTSGEFAVDDPPLAALALLGMVNTINDWFREDGPLTIEQVAETYADLIVGRLLAPLVPA